MAGFAYNGWSGDIRTHRSGIYEKARARHAFPSKAVCIGCSGSLDPVVIPHHAEQYGPTVEDYFAACVPMCPRCHAMLHVRFRTPNRWRQYVDQVRNGKVDDAEYPQARSVAPLLSKFRARTDIAHVATLAQRSDYLGASPQAEYQGRLKAITLLVADETGSITELPDWEYYGARLEKLSGEERSFLAERGVDLEGFLAGKIKPRLSSRGKYQPIAWMKS